MSFEIYAKFDSLGSSSFATLFDFGSGPNDENISLRNTESSKLKFSVNRAAEEKDVEANVGLDANAWTHVFVTTQGTTMKIYKNGVQVGLRTTGWEPSAVSRTQHWLGKSPIDDLGHNEEGFFKGTIAFFKMWHMVSVFFEKLPQEF